MDQVKMIEAIRNNSLSEIQAMNLSATELSSVIMEAVDEYDVLQFAILHKRHAIVEYLIHKGVDINSGKSNGDSPLHEIASFAILARDSSYERDIWMKLLRLILSKGADCTKTNKDGYTTLSEAKLRRDLEVCDLLESYGANCESL